MRWEDGILSTSHLTCIVTLSSSLERWCDKSMCSLSSGRKHRSCWNFPFSTLIKWINIVRQKTMMFTHIPTVRCIFFCIRICLEDRNEKLRKIYFVEMPRKFDWILQRKSSIRLCNTTQTVMLTSRFSHIQSEIVADEFWFYDLHQQRVILITQGITNWICAM